MRRLRYELLPYEKLPAALREKADCPGKDPQTLIVREDGCHYLFLSLGRKLTGGYGLSIERVAEEDKRIVVVYREIAPKPRDAVIQVINHPWLAVKIDSPLPLKVQKVT